MRFRIFGVPVRVLTPFWVIAVLVGLTTRAVEQNVAAVAATMAVVFVAVLVHELGHALTARAFGVEPEVTLHAMGGTTSFRGSRLTRWQHIVTTLAGPGAGFALGAGALLAARTFGLGGELTATIFERLVLCTFGWGALNLLPVLPLDGGIVMREALGPRFARGALVLSALFGLALGLLAAFAHVAVGGVYLFPNLFLALLFASSTVQSARAAWSFAEAKAGQAARAELAQNHLADARRVFARGDYEGALVRLQAAAQFASDAATRDAVRRLFVEVALERGDAHAVGRTLDTLEAPEPADDLWRADALDRLGERTAAFALLERRSEADPAGPAFVALARGLVATGQLDRALGIAHALATRASFEGVAVVAEALAASGRDAEAVPLWHALETRGDPAAMARRRARAGLDQDARSPSAP